MEDFKDTDIIYAIQLVDKSKVTNRSLLVNKIDITQVLGRLGQRALPETIL